MAHAFSIASRMRAEDAAEGLATYNLDPYDVMVQNLKSSDRAWTWMVDGVPACMFGYTSPSNISNVIYPWLMTTDLVEKHRTMFLRYSRPMLEVMLSQSGKLENFVDARYKSCIRWLKWCGFTLHAPQPFGAHGLPFHRFERSA